MSLQLRFTVPGQVERTVVLDSPSCRIGALLSNQVVLRAPGVDPIHALLEEDASGWMVTDLGSATGVKLNGQVIDVETRFKMGDQLGVGSVTLQVEPAPGVAGEATAHVAAPPPPLPGGSTVAGGSGAVAAATVKAEPELDRRAATATVAAADGKEGPERNKDQLFSPRKARPSGDVLEVVAYWGDTVLETELFHQTYKGFEQVTIGDPTKAHLIAAGRSHFDSYKLASVREGGFKVYLRKGMKARIRKSGKVVKAEGPKELRMGRRDIAHIKYGAVRYFMMFVRPPELNLPRTGPQDPVMLGLAAFAMLFYLVLVPVAWIHTPDPKKEEKDDIWSVVEVPEKEKPKPPVEKKKKKPKPKAKKKPIELAKKKTPPKKPKPPKPKKPVKPAKPIEKAKPKQKQKVAKPVKAPKPTKVITQNKSKAVKNPTPFKQVAKNANAKAPGPKTKNNNRAKKGPKASAIGKGMPGINAKNPNFKLVGPKIPNKALGKAGGKIGAGMKQKGGARKGKQAASVMGVKGVKNNKASGVNLSKLGLGVGKLINKKGGIATNFKSSQGGGLGGGMGSASKTYGFGGVGSGKSLGIAGGDGKGWGAGTGGYGSGQGGSGGHGGAGFGKGFGGGQGGLGKSFGGGGGKGGRGRANVSVPPGDPVVFRGVDASGDHGCHPRQFEPDPPLLRTVVAAFSQRSR